LRTPLVALAVMAGAWCGTAAGWALAVLAGLVGVSAVVAWRLRSRAVAVALLCAVAAGGVGVLAWWTAEASPLTVLARQQAVVDVEAVVTGDTVRWAPRGPLPGRLVVNVNVRRLDARGRVFTLRRPAQLLMALTADELVVGQRVSLTARASWLDDGATSQVRLTALGVVTVLAAPNPIDRALNRARAGLRSSMAHSPPEQAGLVPGVVVGDVSGLPPELDQAFRATSLTHLTAVSGTNLTLMIVFLVAAARVCGVRGWWLRGVTIVGIVLFIALCRSEPSVLRASAMGVVGLAATGITAQPGSGLRHWGVAVAAVCLLQPSMSHSWGFVMSAAATAGILWWSPHWSRALQAWAPVWLSEAIAIPLAAQLATQPLITALSGQVSLVGIFANMLAAPFVGPVTILGLMACLCSTLLAPLATVFGWLAGWCVEPVILVAKWLGGLPAAQITWGASQWGATALALIALVASCWVLGALAPQILCRWWSTVLAFTLLGVGAMAPFPVSGWPGSWAVVFCDVGQGDAVVLKVTDGVGVLVDAGPDPPSLKRCLADLHIKRLALVILSHEHADHVAGAAGLAHYVTVDQVWVRDGLPPAALTGTAALLGDPGISVSSTHAGQSVMFGDLQWVTLRSGPLGPVVVPSDGGDDPQPNNASVIGLAVVAGLRILLTGDAETEEQSSAVSDGADLRADVLEVPHHGSSRQDPGFLAATGAALAIISVGAGNSYGHPASRTVDALQRDGMQVYRTDQWGALALAREGNSVQVRPQHRPP